MSAKKDLGTKQEMKRESLMRGRMEMDELWRVKKEIKEEMAKDMISTNFESDILTLGVMMKEVEVLRAACRASLTSPRI